MKKLKYIFAILVLALSILPLFVVNAVSTTVSVNKTVTASQFTDGVYKFTVDVSSYADDLLGSNGGTLSVGNVSHTGGVSVGARISGKTVSITLTISDESTFTSVTVNSFILNGTPNESTLTPTATENATPTATATSTVTATPTGSPDGSPGASPTSSSDVSPTPDGSPSASPSSSPNSSDDPSASPSTSPSSSAGVTGTATTTPKVTAKPTKRPSTSERTNDPYNRDWETQAPPTIPPEVTMKPQDLATPVAGETTPVPTPALKVDPVGSANITKGLVILFLVLILLLAVDIYAIFWRKRMGYENMINNGISRRKVQDLCDYPEDALPSDLEQAIMEDAKAEEEQKEDKESE